MSGFKGYGGDDLPDPKELFRRLRSNASWVVWGAVLVLAIVGVAASYYTVEADERAIVLRLGRPTGEIIEPGLHFRIPLIDQVHKAQTTKIRQLEFGFRTQSADVQSRTDENVRQEGLMLTGDLELVNVQWTVLYRINDLQDYLFNVRGVETTIRDISQATVRLLVGDRSSDEVMTTLREEVAGKAASMLQTSLDRAKAGIFVESVALRQVEPPPAAQEAFNRVNEARARKQQMIERAKREKEVRVSPMIGRKEKIIAQARGARDRTIKEAEGEAARFRAVLSEYRRNPDVTRRWIYLETMLRVWDRVGRKFVLDQGSGSHTLQVLPLGDLMGGGSSGSGGAGPQAAPQEAPPSRIVPLMSTPDAGLGPAPQPAPPAPAPGSARTVRP
jgi:membrane protease subunit HflK